METIEVRNVSLWSLKLPKTAPSVKKRRPIAIWETGESPVGRAKEARLKETKKTLPNQRKLSIPRKSYSPYEDYILDEIISEDLILCSTSTQCSSPENKDLYIDKRKYKNNDFEYFESNKIAWPGRVMDLHNKNVNSSKPELTLNFQTIDSPKNDGVSQPEKDCSEPPLKSVSCSELSAKYLKSSSSTDVDSKTVFFNERGWPVKIMRLTEVSPPKANKPWPSRSLPTNSLKKSPRKEKSVSTQKKPVTKLSREDKENKKYERHKEKLLANNTESVMKQSDQKKVATEKTSSVDVQSDLKTMLEKLDQTMDELAPEKDTDYVKATSEPKNKDTDKRHRNVHVERKSPRNDIKKDNAMCSARSNKYNSKEVKAYMQAKRVERKQHMSEETRKKQDVLEIQKKNLEKLREKALQVLKKSSTKTVEESKPKWQGPLEEDNSDVSPPAIHIFESKIPTPKKSKLIAKPDGSDICSSVNSEKGSVNEKISSKEEVKDIQEEKQVTVDKLCEDKDMDSKNCKLKGKKTTKLRLSKHKPSIEDPQITIAMEAKALDIVPELEKKMAKVRRSFESLAQSPKLSNEGSFHHFTLTDINQLPNSPCSSRKTTFVCTPRTDFSAFDSSSKTVDQMDVTPTSSHRKRHQLTPANTNNLTPKKICDKSIEDVTTNKSILEGLSLMKIQREILQKQIKGKEPELLESLIKPDGFSVMNVMRMKLLTNENKYILETRKKEGHQQKFTITKSCLDDDTDAPSIVSMEEDIRVHPEPLRLSDLQLKLDRSGNSSLASQVSPERSEGSLSSKRHVAESLKSSSVSSYTYDAPPLVIPESVQHLKLSSKRSYNELSSSSSQFLNNNFGALSSKVSNNTYSNSAQEKPASSQYSVSSQRKTSHSRHSTKENSKEESIQSEQGINDTSKEVETIQGSNPAALFLQFHAELSRLDAFDQSLAQVIAAERLHSISTHVGQHVCNRLAHTPSDRNAHNLVPEEGRKISAHEKGSRSSQYSSVFEQPSSEMKASPPPSGSDVSSIKTVTSQNGQLSVSRSASSLHSVAEQISPLQGKTQSETKEVPQKHSHFLSFSSPIPLSFSPKSIHILQVLIDDAQFQRKQIELMYKTQEDILLAQYKAELSEVDLCYRRNGQLTSKGIETRRIVEEKYETPLIKLRERRDQALSSSDARLEYLMKQMNWLRKQKKCKTSRPRSAEASPKKLTPIRSISLTSVVENSSSSESSFGMMTFEDKKREEAERERALTSTRKKIEKEMFRKLQEELARVQDLEKVDRSPKSGRSRRDKSTSPLESVPETSTRDAACSITENISAQATSSSLRTVEEARSTDVYNSESFESPESSETPRQPKMISKAPLAIKPHVTGRPNNKSKVLIKVPLSPRLQVRSKRRGSSGSDESLLLSQNETQSEQSDYEVRISALKEQKRQRFAELNRLERELKRAQREQLKATEAALVKQIQAYESKITQTKKQLEEVTATNSVRPQIKHPRVSDKFFPRTSDVFQKTQTVEEQPKQQEHNASDVDTNSLKSVSEASSTETTIQSSGQVQITEETSKPAADVDSENKDVSSSNIEVTEVLSSVASEAPTVLDSQKSVESEIPDVSEPVEKSVNSVSTNMSNDESNWIDAEDFFSQLDQAGKDLSNESACSKVSSENSLTSVIPETILSAELTNESQNALKSISSSQEVEEAEEIVGSTKTESPANSTPESEHHYHDKSPDVELSVQVAEVEEKDTSNKLDIGRVVSIISQSPSSSTLKTVSESQSSLNTELNSVSHASLASCKPDSDVSPCDNDINHSLVTNEKSDVSEVQSQINEALLASDSSVTSQCYSEGGENNSNAQSDVDETFSSSQSEVIKVFVSNKTQEIPEEKTAPDNNNINLSATFISKSKEKPVKDEALVDKITDKILQNLLSECVVCNKGEKKTIVNKNIVELEESNQTLSAESDGEPKTSLSVDDFTQTVLNKFLKDATDCMLRISESKKAANTDGDSVSPSKESKKCLSELSSNKLLEALALERKVIASSEKGLEETTPSPKSGKSSNNEVELNDGNESEVFWFDEDLQPVNLQTQREAEELRLKQLQIEQEIERLKQLEAQAQEKAPYYYVREIPNKPPPPYTPPGQSVQAMDLQPVPARQKDVESMVSAATQALMAVWRRGDDLSAIEPSEDYCSAKIGNQVYNKFLYDLVKQIFIDITSNGGDEKDLPPWEKTGCRMKRKVLPKLTDESVSSFVLKKVRVLFGFEPDSIKENLIIQWSRKKRDRVDELLVRESQEEEREWTDYSKCEVAVKNNVALSIFDSLIEDTGVALSKSFQKKLIYSQQST